jgi:hypothetical protein
VLDIAEMYNVWDSTLYKVIHRTVTRLYDVLPDWPLTAALDADSDAPLRALSEGFHRRSGCNLSGVIGAIDGLLVPIRAPHDSLKARAYHHCRKGFSCINVQAICDTNYRLTYCSIGRTPGAVHDSYAWGRDPMHARLHSPDSPIAAMLKRRGYYLIGDDAYACNHTMSVPWPGKWAADSPQLAYNYHHSSARIAVEQTFGMLVRKWLVLKRPYEGSLKRTTRSAGVFLTVAVCCKLVRPFAAARAQRPLIRRPRSLSRVPTCPQHNYCIEKDSMCGEVLPEDLRGDRDPDLPAAADRQRARPRDHHGRDRALDPRAVHLSGRNPDLAAVEEGDECRAAALEPAWYEDSEYSPRDPLYALSAKPGAHQALLCSPRAAVTARMEAHGQIRPPSAPVHW